MSTHTDTRLRDRHIIVTGGAHDIGHSVAVRCARAGANVSIFDTGPGVTAKTAGLVREEDGEAEVHEVDVTDAEGVETAVNTIIDSLGDIHGLANSAGVQQAVPFLKTTGNDWNLHFGMNAKGTFLVSKTVVNRMVDGDIEGSVVNISSVDAEQPFPGQGAYGVSKAAVLALTTVLTEELNDHGIAVNAFKPGAVETPMAGEWLDKHAKQSGRSPDGILAEMLNVHILDRIGQPEEVSHVVILLLFEEGDWITSEPIVVDGGYFKH